MGGYQIDIERDSGFAITTGHSGGAVIDDELGAVVALCRSREPNELVRVGRIIPIGEVARCWPDLAPWLGWRIDEQRVATSGTERWRTLDVRRADALRSHWHPRAHWLRGNSANDAGVRYFRGRVAARGELNDWLNDPYLGVVVVTGEPGAGKSAVVARTVLDHSFGYAFFAKDRVSTDFVRGLCDALGDRPSDEIERAAELVYAYQGERQRRLTIAVDGLDEAARGEDLAIVEIAARFARSGAKVLIGSRRDAVKRLTDRRTIDLDDDRYFDHDDLATYCADVLCRADLGDKANAWASAPNLTEEANAIAVSADRNFLVAGLLALTRGMDEPGSPEPSRKAHLSAAFDELIGAIDKRLGWDPL